MEASAAAGSCSRPPVAVLRRLNHQAVLSYRTTGDFEIVSAIPQLDLTERIKTLIRRDLKLGTEVELQDDQLLFGGDLDLDSLDALLLLQSVEREFDIQVPADAVNPDAFRTVSALAQFVERRRAIGHG